MRRFLDVSGLTRPQRIRCRPSLLSSTWATTLREYSLPAPKKHQRSKNYDQIRSSAGRSRLDELDYEEAIEATEVSSWLRIGEVGEDAPLDFDMEPSSILSTSSLIRKPKKKKLPSLSDPSSFGRTSREADLYDGPIAGPSRLPMTSEPSRPAINPSDLPSPSISASSPSPPTKIRRNPVGVQLLSPSLHSQLFPGPGLPEPPSRLLNISRDHLKSHGLSPDGAAILPEINFEMPPLRGRNIREHFIAVGEETAEPYLGMAEEFARMDLPPMPEVWEMGRAGWTRYGRDGSVEAVPDLGDEKTVCFDVETLYKLSPYPVMATAATPNAWYSWLSPTLFDTPPTEPDPKREFWDTQTPSHHCHDLIPLFSRNHERIVVGHNVGYDRQRVKEEYKLSRSATVWLDTLSLHVATRGITSVQRPAWLKHKKNKAEKVKHTSEALAVLMEEAENDGDEEMFQTLSQWGTSAEGESENEANRWEDVTAANSLADVAALHCNIPVDKSVRNRFGDDTITHASQLVPELHELLAYCATDVYTTHEVYKQVFPLYRASCPHPATFAGVLTMGSSFLPVNESWERYLKAAEEKFVVMDEGVRKALRVLAEKLRMEGKQEGDVWAEQLDWTPKSARWANPDPTADDSIEPTTVVDSPLPSTPPSPPTAHLPSWYSSAISDPSTLIDNRGQRNLLPLLLRLSFRSHPVILLREHSWCFLIPEDQIGEYIDTHGEPVHLGPKDGALDHIVDGFAIFRIGGPKDARKTKLTGPGNKKLVTKGEITSPYPQLLSKLVLGHAEGLEEDLRKCVEDMRGLGKEDVWGAQLDWTEVQSTTPLSSTSETATSAQCDSSSAPSPTKPKSKSKSKSKSKASFGSWPKWYWDLTGPETSTRIPFGELDLTTRKSLAPLLLRLQWKGYPLIHHRDHKWVYRMPKADAVTAFAETDVEPSKLAPYSDADYWYFRLPHKDGEGKNVGNPLSRSFVKAIESDELASAAAAEGDDNIARKAAADATNMNVLCSYWMSSRDRIKEQMVVYDDEERTSGMILPKVITMGTVTRRAVESTWLTASNAKKNRVGSELKAMVRAPPGYALVGADVDSEELWISSVMGDSQFGCHGATAIGWMTLEGTKSAGTDLHSKTAKILGISRDDAKVFNYSRIYGAGQKHAVQLLMQGDASLTKKAATERALQLYKATKGNKSTRDRTRPPAARQTIWHGGSESFLFNTLEAIALSDRPTTPALGCGVTRALRKSYLEESSSYLPSRINWVVQSSGVDYLHLLITSMEYLLKRYDISARYLISVHDEVRYLAKEEDRYRCALALQVANAWTRALFCFNLGISDVPQGVAFFSAVDVDHVLRKEVFMSCETPSHPTPIPAGESLNILEVLEKTKGSLGDVVRETEEREVEDPGQPVQLFPDLTSATHVKFLEAQAGSLGAPAKRWLNEVQKPLAGYEGMVPIAKEVERVVKDGEKGKRKVVAGRKSK